MGNKDGSWLLWLLRVPNRNPTQLRWQEQSCKWSRDMMSRVKHHCIIRFLFLSPLHASLRTVTSEVVSRCKTAIIYELRQGWRSLIVFKSNLSTALTPFISFRVRGDRKLIGGLWGKSPISCPCWCVPCLVSVGSIPTKGKTVNPTTLLCQFKFNPQSHLISLSFYLRTQLMVMRFLQS